MIFRIQGDVGPQMRCFVEQAAKAVEQRYPALTQLIYDGPIAAVEGFRVWDSSRDAALMAEVSRYANDKLVEVIEASGSPRQKCQDLDG